MQQNLWKKVLGKLEKRINRPSFNTWLRPTICISMKQHDVCIGVPDEVFVYWLGEHYVYVITETLAEILGFQPAISFAVMDDEKDDAGPVGNVRQSMNSSSPQGEPCRPVRNRTKKQDQTLIQAFVNSGNGQRSTVSPKKSLGETTGYTMLKKRQNFGPGAKDTRVSPAPQVKNSNMTASHDMLSPARTSQPKISGSLSPMYTFDSYVVGNNNRFAHAAALAVSDQMAVNYNPLFIYGGVGLGKTHLLHAIGNHLAGLRPNLRILYLSSEQFINELVFSIREDRMVRFREKYRSIDLLLVDDIQFIARKERTQEEFFHTFNTLYQARKQIVLTSDSPPKKIPTIAEQLRSRFEWGLIADIQPPDLETRIAILKKKADLQHIDLPDDVAIYIASKVKSNIRELEGCLSKIKAYSTFNHQTIAVELAQRVLQDIFETRPRKITVTLVQQVVANHYHVEPESMRSSARNRKVTFPRQIAMYLVRELTNLSLPDIGRNFGGRDHTTVMHACKKIERSQAQDRKFKESIMQIRELIRA